MASRQSAQTREVSSLIGKLRHFTIILRPGRYMVWRLEFCTRRADAPPYTEAASSKASRVELSEEFHADLEWWKWAVYQTSLLEGISLKSPFYGHVHWPPTRHWLSDATLKAVGGHCLALRVWWRCDLSEEEQRRAGSEATCAAHNKLSSTCWNCWPWWRRHTSWR